NATLKRQKCKSAGVAAGKVAGVLAFDGPLVWGVKMEFFDEVHGLPGASCIDVVVEFGAVVAGFEVVEGAAVVRLACRGIDILVDIIFKETCLEDVAAILGKFAICMV